MFKRVLIANRGEIAVRIARTLRELGISPVAVYSDVDRVAPHVQACDAAYPIGAGPANQSYLRTDALLDAAQRSHAEAIHPGYGFLSENAAFAEQVRQSGLVFIGPPSQAMRIMASKTQAREAMRRAGVPVVPGSDTALTSDAQASSLASQIGYPVMLKAAAGGGGKGMRLVSHASELSPSLRLASSEAKGAFGDDTVYMEKAIVNPRHVEIQIFSGSDGRCMYMGERECSMQRRHQKVIEETPSPALDEDLRRRMGEVACQAAQSVGYEGAGTVEFLLDSKRHFYFLEMNTRLQVEHAITELCYGVDLVAAQVEVAAGLPVAWQQEDFLKPYGHAMEARIYAEDPQRDFLPCPGPIEALFLPHGPGVRVDCGVMGGFEVSQYYDPMIAKVAVWGETRERARRRLLRALLETVVKGITTNTAFLRHLADSSFFKQGSYHTGTLGMCLSQMQAGTPMPAEVLDAATLALVISRFRNDQRASPSAPYLPYPTSAGWRAPSWRARGD